MAILGVWMWPQSVQIHGAKKTVEYCVRAGVTDIYFLAKGLAGTTAHLGAIAPACCDRDLLGELLSAAHARGVRVHAWLTSASDEHYKQLHPESGRCHYTRGKDKGLITLTDEGYMSYMEHVISELCQRDIDGLHLDYIRYNHLLYGWDESDLRRYAQAGADIGRLRALMDAAYCTGQQGDPTPLFDAYRAGDESALAFARTRRQDVARFARRMIAAAKAARSGLVLSAALMPEGAYADTTFSDLHYGQNYEDAAALYDFALPMAYSNAYGKDGAWVRTVAEGTLARGLKTIVGLHAYEGGTGSSLQADIAALADTPVDGICLFREGAFAMAFAAGRTLSLYNPTAEPITRIIASCGDACIACEQVIPAGDEQRLALPFTAECMRAFAGDKEICVHLTAE